MGKARELGAVRPLDDQRHRHVGERDGGVVAQHGHELHGLAGAIDAAFGVEEGVDRAGLVAAGDAAIGKVERRLGEFEAGELLLAGVGRHHREGLGRAAAFQEPGGEIDTAVGGGDRLGDRFVAARQQHDLEAGERLGALQGAREDIETVLAGEAGQRDVGVHHPHAGRLAAGRVVVVIVEAARRRRGGVPHHDEIGAGLPILDRLADREGGDHRLVGRAAHFHRAAPLADAVGAVQPAAQRPRLGDRLGAGKARVVAIVGETVDRALVDPVDLDADLGDVDGGDRQADRRAARQDEALARQGDDGRTGAQRHVDLHFVIELGAIAARETRQHPHRVILAVGEAADAEAVVDHAQRRLHLRGDAHIVGIFDVAGRQRLVEGKARLGLGPAAVDGDTAIGEGFVGGGRRLGDRRGRHRSCRRRGRRWGRGGVGDAGGGAAGAAAGGAAWPFAGPVVSDRRSRRVCR